MGALWLTALAALQDDMGLIPGTTQWLTTVCDSRGALTPSSGLCGQCKTHMVCPGMSNPLLSWVPFSAQDSGDSSECPEPARVLSDFISHEAHSEGVEDSPTQPRTGHN